MQKGAAQLLLLALVLIVIASGIYFYSQRSFNSSKGTNLQASQLALPTIPQDKNYSNPLGFQFQYPNGLTVKEDSEEEFSKRGKGDFRKNFRGYVGYEPGQFLGAVAVLAKDGNFDTNPFTLWVFDNPDNITIDSWFDKYWYYPFLWGVFDYVSKGHVTLDQEATVSGMMAKYKVVSYQPSSPKYIYVSNNKKMYLFRIIGSDGDKILQSFKFL